MDDGKVDDKFGTRKTSKIVNSMISALQCPEKSTCFTYFADRFDCLLSASPDVIPGTHLPYLTKLVLVLFDKFCDNCELYEYYFMKLIEYLSLPVKNLQTGEFYVFTENIRELYNAFGYIFVSTQNVEVVRKVLGTIISYARQKKDRVKKKIAIANSLAESKLPEIISELLLMSEFDLYLEYLNALESIMVTESDSTAILYLFLFPNMGDDTVDDKVGTRKISKIVSSMISALQCPEKSTCLTYFADRFNCLLSTARDFIPGTHLPYLTKLVLILFEKLCDNYQLYECYFTKLIEYLSLPIKMSNSSEFFTFTGYVRDFYNALGYILASTQNVRITRKVLGTIISYARQKKDCLKKNIMFTNALAESKLPEIISELLLISEFDLYHEYLNALEHIMVTELDIQAFLKHNVIDVILSRLSHKWLDFINYTDEELIQLAPPVHLNVSNKVLWIFVLTYTNSSEEFKASIGVIASRRAWRSGRNTMVTLVEKGDRRDRNSFYMLLRILETTGLNRFEYYGHLNYDLHAMAFLSEVPQQDQSSWMSRVQFYNDNLDFEFKIALLSALCLKDEAKVTNLIGLEGLRLMNAIPALLIILDVNVKLIWTTAQRKKLMYYALLGLQDIISITFEDFLLHHGPERLLDVVEGCLLDTLPVELLFPALYCIYTCLKVENNVSEATAEKYVGNGLIRSLSIFLERTLQCQEITKMNQNCLGVVYCILGRLMANIRNKLDYITRLSVTLLKKFVYSTPEGFLFPHTVIAIIDYLWENITYIRRNLQFFVSCEGVYLLLDIIERFPLPLKLISLSVLCDLCEINSCLACMLTWRGKGGNTIVPLLAKTYREQAKFDRRHVYPERARQDKDDSTIGKYPRKVSSKYSSNVNCSLVLLELLGNCKPKISGILHFLNCSSDTPPLNECYHISTGNLSGGDKIIVVVAERYFTLKMGEAWIEVNRYLGSVGIRPLKCDELVLAFRKKQYYNCLRYIHLQQIYYQIQETKEEIKVERTLYNTLREQLLSESLDALQELNRLAISSRKRFLLRESNRMIEAVSQSQLPPSNFHTTLPEGFHVNIRNNKISIQSDVVIDLNKEEPPKFVSPPESFTENVFEDIKYAQDSGISWQCGLYHADEELDRIRKCVDDLDD